MNLYVDQKEKYADTKSTAWSFSIVGGVGLILLILVYFDVIPLHLDKDNIIMMFLIMAVLFIFFIFVGIKSFLSLGQIAKSANQQENHQKESKEWFLNNYKSELLNLTSNGDSEEELFLERNEYIVKKLSENFIDLSEEDCEYIAELIYNEIFDANLSK